MLFERLPTHLEGVAALNDILAGHQPKKEVPPVGVAGAALLARKVFAMLDRLRASTIAASPAA